MGIASSRLVSLTTALFLLTSSSLSLSTPSRRHDPLTTATRRRFLTTAPALIASLTADSEHARALSPDQAASDYDTYAADYDALDGGSAASMLGIDQARLQLIRQSRGKVLEIGVGTGLNLPNYDASSVSSLTLVDVSNNMLQAAQERVKSLPNLRNVPVEYIKADATSDLVSLFGEASFDTVVDTFSLCVMGNSGTKLCLQQLRRVVKPTGRLLLLENSRSDNPLLGLYQDATADAAAAGGGKGCVYNQNVDAMLREANLVILNTQSYAAGLFRSYECATQ